MASQGDRGLSSQPTSALHSILRTQETAHSSAMVYGRVKSRWSDWPASEKRGSKVGFTNKGHVIKSNSLEGAVASQEVPAKLKIFYFRTSATKVQDSKGQKSESGLAWD